MDKPIPVERPLAPLPSNFEIPAWEYELSFSRSSGPGGQNVNKVNSKATLRWNPSRSSLLPGNSRERFIERFASRLTEQGELLLSSDRLRDQKRNIEDCLDKLRDMIREARVPPKKRKATKPTRSSGRRRVEGKRKDSETKQGRGRVKSD